MPSKRKSSCGISPHPPIAEAGKGNTAASGTNFARAGPWSRPPSWPNRNVPIAWRRKYLEESPMWSTSYRLGELKITESDGGEVWWESHYGLGSCREGRCYKQGEVLFIGPSQTETLGFLKGEFLDSIRSLPPWTKTKYHCKLPTVYHCGSGKRVSDEENPAVLCRSKTPAS